MIERKVGDHDFKFHDDVCGKRTAALTFLKLAQLRALSTIKNASKCLKI
jgi:hypothetical protein